MLKRFSLIIPILLALGIVNGCAIDNKPITQQEARRIAENFVTDSEKADINNLSSPEIALFKEKSTHKTVLPHNGKGVIFSEIKGKTVWQVTYHTNSDGLLGPIVVYIDFYTGKIYGTDLRY